LRPIFGIAHRELEPRFTATQPKPGNASGP
jgi:hypothetical protein